MLVLFILGLGNIFISNLNGTAFYLHGWTEFISLGYDFLPKLEKEAVCPWGKKHLSLPSTESLQRKSWSLPRQTLLSAWRRIPSLEQAEGALACSAHCPLVPSFTCPNAEHSVCTVKYLESLLEDINYNFGAESENFQSSEALSGHLVWDPGFWVGTEAPRDEVSGPR